MRTADSSPAGRRGTVVVCALAFLSVSACSSRFPARPPGAPPSSAATELLAKSVAASGGDPYEMYRDIAVAYRGEWGTLVQVLQPVLTDGEYRGRSEERLLLAEGVIAQIHEGAAGRKVVLRDTDEVLVSYDGVPTTDQDVRETSALVADAYAMFLLGSAWLLRHGSDWARLENEESAGRSYARVIGRLRPGVGLSEADDVVVWIDRSTDLLHRVHFTLEGHRFTQGAHVDVTFADYRQAYGRMWPTHFVERVRSPVDIHAHEWWMEGLDVDRGIGRNDLAGTAWSDVAAAPAKPDGL